MAEGCIQRQSGWDIEWMAIMRPRPHRIKHWQVYEQEERARVTLSVLALPLPMLWTSRWRKAKTVFFFPLQ